MRTVTLADGADLAGFRRAVRLLIGGDVPPEAVVWSPGEAPDLFAGEGTQEGRPIALPRAVGDLVRLVVCHRDPERYALLYDLVWRVTHGERHLLEVMSDPLVHRLHGLRKAIGRDLHKMHAFVRFRRLVDDAGNERFFAWFEPDHFIVEETADFFVDRFRSMDWTIVTPVGSLHWDRENLAVGPAGRREDVPADDAFEAGWRTYYENIFNPARLNTRAMRAEMPKKYWKNMPETASLSGMIENAPSRVRDMIEREASVPAKRNPTKAVAAMDEQEPKTLEELNRIIAASEPLVPGATQAVLGEGPTGASLAFVGEQPGDQEDMQGRPFVGPAGQLLNRALAEAGIERGQTYMTNAVKHFKYEQRGKRRIHQKPTTSEIKHYRWWLMKELDFVRPQLTVALGATAAHALAGKQMAVGRNRGFIDFDGRSGYLTVHPSYLLRLPDEAAKEAAWRDFVGDLKRIGERAGVAA
ncbi:UdgX family uracil-DNA binding protein [Pararhizobium mangrovi]|uniref:Type-4 uracil-DNA glycosylase n=2 Tax=Pararhizobium mangrovi TaxID=2590452 RepID=A0A506TYH4_9HYPH|nr:UdgX family uracil-DNA binding protein [Pararhizobium mangrovi]